MHKRLVERPQMMTYIEVLCADTGKRLGRLVDLTTHGARLITDEELELEAHYRLLINVEAGLGGTQELHIDARCMWIGHDVNPELNCAGFEFDSLDARQKAMLERLIHDQRFEHLVS